MSLRNVSTAAGAFFLLTACSTALNSGSEAGPSITVFAASSLTDAFGEMGQAFQAANPGHAVVFSFAGSQTLRTQIEAGAAPDVFASANSREMHELVAEGLVATDATQVFLTNRLVIILPPENPAGLAEPTDLQKPGLKVVLAAEDVPVGSYTRQALEAMNGTYGSGFRRAVLANVVSNEDNVRQVVSKVLLGEADAGIVYASDAIAAPEILTIEIPAEINVVAHYPIAVLKDSSNSRAARKFVQFVLSATGRSILARWGFGPPE